MQRRRKISPLVCSLVVVIAGCMSAPTSTTGVVTDAPSAASLAPAWPAGAPDAWLLVGRAGERGVSVIQASTGESSLEMPAGIPARADWLHVIAATPNGARTTIGDVLVQPGLGGPEVVIDGAWTLPSIGYDPMPVGLSADGSTVVLVEGAPPPEGAAVMSRFAVLNVAPLEGPPQIVELPGLFEYDAISSDGKILYVVQHLPGKGSPYQVRAIDLPAGKMRDAIITDKRNIGEAMVGWPLAQLRSPNGLVFTLYGGLEHPFIHALNTTDAWAVCIDMPAANGEDQESGTHWGLAASSDWRTVYATNAALGLVSEVDTTELTIRRSVSVESAAVGDRSVAGGPAIDLAKFGHQEGGPVGRRTVAAPDGRTVYAAGPEGILAIRTSDLAVTARLLEGSAVEALGLSRDGRALFALLRHGGRIVALDPASGAMFGEVPGDGFDRLVAIVPW